MVTLDMKVFLLAPNTLSDLVLSLTPQSHIFPGTTDIPDFLLSFLAKEAEKQRFVVTRSLHRGDPLLVDQVESNRLLDLYQNAVSGTKETRRQFESISLPSARHQIHMKPPTDVAWLIVMKSTTDWEISVVQ